MPPGYEPVKLHLPGPEKVLAEVPSVVEQLTDSRATMAIYFAGKQENVAVALDQRGSSDLLECAKPEQEKESLQMTWKMGC